MAKKDSQRIIEIRQKANQHQKEQKSIAKRKTILLQTGIVVGILLIVTAITLWVLFSQTSKTTNNNPSADQTISLLGAQNVPFVVEKTAVTVGKKDAPVKIDLYEDYSCPHCAEYEAAVGPTLLKLAADGDAIISFHPIRVVTNYGLNAGSAAACVAEKDAQNWPNFHTELFTNHSEISDSWGGKDFVTFAKSSGITNEDTLKCISSGNYVDWISANTSASRDVGVTGTPTLFINGNKLDSLLGPDELLAAVDAAKTK